MLRVPLILAHETLRRLARAAGRRAGIPAAADLSFRWGRWYVHRHPPRPDEYGVAVWPEGDGHGGVWSESFDRVDRGAVFAVLSAAWHDGGNCVVVTLTRDEVTGDGAEALRRERERREAEADAEMEAYLGARMDDVARRMGGPDGPR